MFDKSFFNTATYRAEFPVLGPERVWDYLRFLNVFDKKNSDGFSICMESSVYALRVWVNNTAALNNLYNDY